MTIRFLSAAESELGTAARYYERQVSGLGSDFLDEIEAVVSRIKAFPEAWSPVSGSFRRCRLHRFPYALVYEMRPSAPS